MGSNGLIGTVLAALFIASSASAASDASSLTRKCVSCHGSAGTSTEPTTPIIAGLSRGYLVAAMLAYKHPDDLPRAQTTIEGDPELQDVVVLKRPAISGDHIPPEFGIEEIKTLARYYAAQDVLRPAQSTDPARAEAGQKLHDKYCEKCHENGGRNTADDVGLLAGQWKPYLSKTLASFVKGDRQMPKKMSEKMDALREKHGDEGLESLTHFYASQR